MQKLSLITLALCSIHFNTYAQNLTSEETQQKSADTLALTNNSMPKETVITIPDVTLGGQGKIIIN